jgi:hypothetical protein
MPPGRRRGAARETVKHWPTGGWHMTEIFEQYDLALTRGVTSGLFLR